MNPSFSLMLLALAGLVGTAHANGKLSILSFKDPYTAARAETARDIAHLDRAAGSSEGDPYAAGALRARLLKTSKSGMVKTFKVQKRSGTPWFQIQSVRKMPDGWRAYEKPIRTSKLRMYPWVTEPDRPWP